MARETAGPEQLKSIPLFEGLSDKELRAVADRSRIVEHLANHEIVVEGSGSIGFHLILDGQATVRKGSRVIGTLGPNDYFGEISLIDGKPRAATVTTDTPVRSVVLSSSDFRSLLEENPTLTHKILLGLCRTIRAKESASQ